MPDSLTTIHAFPELRQLAEREARAAYDAFVRYSEEHPRHLDTGRRRTMTFVWDDDQGTREWWIAAHLTLLCDLSRDASRDAVARVVGERLGWPVGPIAPSLYWTPGHDGPRDIDGAPEGDDWPAGWWLQAADGNMHFFTGADGCPDDATMIHGRVEGNEHAIEALTAIVRHLWPENADAR